MSASITFAPDLTTYIAIDGKTVATVQLHDILRGYSEAEQLRIAAAVLGKIRAIQAEREER